MEGVGVEIASGSWERGVFAAGGQDAQDQIIETGHDPCGIGLGHARVIFVEADISAVVQSVLDAPVRADHSQQTPWGNPITRGAGDAIYNLMLDLASPGGNKAAFQFEDLLEIGPIQKVLQLAAHGQGAGFQASVALVHGFGDSEPKRAPGTVITSKRSPK